MRLHSHQIPQCEKCGARARRKKYLWQWNLSLWGGLTCPNCGDPFSPAPIPHRQLHQLFLKFKKYPFLFSLIPLLGLLVGAALTGLIPLDRSQLNAFANMVGIVIGSIILFCYGLLLVWFLVKLARNQWTAFCHLMLEKYLDE
jgi:hypothetical protein